MNNAKLNLNDYDGEALSIVKEKIVTEENYIPFNINDKLGREIGAKIKKSTITLEASPKNAADSWMYADFYNREAGVYYAFLSQSTRNGKNFGACQHQILFNTEAERETHIEKYLITAIKRAAKSFSKIQ